MTNIPEKFEKQIYRIHKLIEQKGSQVTWNDKIPDPDNLDQVRQIDISIKQDDKLTLVECRIRKKIQDVKWIEELIGRRVSLHADVVIAVSNSGFTQGAKQKAKQYGIFLRDLQDLTEQEIQEWGRGTRVSLTFFEYTDLEIIFVIDTEEGRFPVIDEIVAELERTNNFYPIFEAASELIFKKNPKGQPCRFKGSLSVPNLSICGVRIANVEFIAYVKRKIQNLQIPSVVAYDAPHINGAQRDVLIEKVALGDFEITQSSNRVFVAVDLAPVECPPNSQFVSINFDFGREVCVKSYEILRLPQFVISLENIKFGVIMRT